MKMISNKNISYALLAGLALSASACTSNTASNRSLDTVHQPVVSRTNVAIDLQTSNGTLPVIEQRRLAEWFEAMGLSYGDRVSVDDPAANRGVLSLVQAAASRYGLLVSENAPLTVGNVASSTVRVVVSRSSARVDGCPDWSASSETNFNNATSSNFGCASSSNLAAMVADAEDLVRGNGDGTSDANVTSKAINTQRDAPTSGAGGLIGGATTGGGGGGGGG